MTSEQEQARMIAERIARRVSENRNNTASGRERDGGGGGGGNQLGAELSAVRAGLDELRQRLVQIESRLMNDEGGAATRPERKPQQEFSGPATETSPSQNHPLRLSGIYMPATGAHPSLDRFGVEEATVAELVDFFEGEKRCELEPGGKPCDHCSMCSSRGF